MKTTHQPKGGMCATCRHASRDCSGLDFMAMPTISRKPSADGVLIVRCTDFSKSRRPTREVAENAISEFLTKIGYEDMSFDLVEDGCDDDANNKCSWAFWLNENDTTSYLHEDLTVEWYGFDDSEEEAS